MIRWYLGVRIRGAIASVDWQRARGLLPLIIPWAIIVWLLAARRRQP